MGIIKRGILGGFSKKVGNVVGGSWKGIAYMRSQPLSVANPRTTAQVAQRTKMTDIVSLAQPILGSFIKPLWDRFAVKQSGYNAFVQKNIGIYVPSSPASPASLVMSQGQLGDNADVVASIDISDASLTVGWNTDLQNGFQSLDDDPYVCVINQSNGFIKAEKVESVTRATGTFTITMNGIADNLSDVVFVFLAFRSADGFRVGNSTVAVASIGV